MITQELKAWQPASFGARYRHWYCYRGDNDTSLADRYLRDSRGRVRWFKTFEAAQAAIARADK